MARWYDFPAEIRSIILKRVANDYRFSSEQSTLAGYASVSREWQVFFEYKNFRRLVLDQNRISDLEQIMETGQRRGFLRLLLLRIRLDEYDCTVCNSKENAATIRNNDNVFSRAVWSLLVILSKWTGCVGPDGQQGLMLEIGAYSPSDSKHTFRDFHLEHNYPYQTQLDLDPKYQAYKSRVDKLGLDSLNDPYHGWVDGQRGDVSLESKQRIMGTLTIKSNLPEFSVFLQRLPKVEIIVGLLIRRQYYRKIAAKSLNKLLRESFTCLRWFRHEAWYDVDPQRQLTFDKAYKGLVSNNLPSTLRDLFIFEDFNKLLHPGRSTKRVNRPLGRTLSKSSRSLERLSAAFIVDAEDFFADFWQPTEQNPNVNPWENLRCLALTSHLLHPKIKRDKINKLLMAASRAAACMPKLVIMEIWNGGEGQACVFQYRSLDRGPKITWACTWVNRAYLDHSVVQCWANLPRHRQNPDRNLTVAVEKLPKKFKRAKTFITTLRYLKMRFCVINMVSDYQLSWEELNHLKV